MSEETERKIRVLCDYNSSILPTPVGRNNPGVYCFFNAMMAVLYSCPIFIERMIVAAKDKNSHSFCRAFISEYNAIKDYTMKDIVRESSLVTIFMNCLKNNEITKHSDFHKRVQQSDSVEGIELMLAMLEKTNPEIYNIFQYRYERSMTCSKCKQVCMVKRHYETIHRMFKIHPTNDNKMSKEDIFTYNLSRYIHKFEDYCCSICNGWKEEYDDESDSEEHKTKDAIRTSGLTIDKLSIIPEVLGIQVNHRWDRQSNTNYKRIPYFPKEIKFKKPREDAYLHYKLIAQIEQSGTTRGGHYWARCLRNGKVYKINDSSVELSKFECTAETCFVMYHHYIPEL